MGLWNNPPYYLTAYGLAVKHGYTGTETQWLKSLKGDPGADLMIERSFDTYAEMIAHYTSTKPTGFVRVGSEADDYLLYYWDAVEEEWRSITLQGPQGEQGETGPAPIPVSESYAFAVSNSGTTPPTSGWVSVIVDVDSVKGKYVWTRTTTHWDNGQETYSYGCAYNGADATGAVISVNGRDGVVNLLAQHIPADDSDTIQTHLDTDEAAITALETLAGDGELNTLATDLTAAVNELKANEETQVAGEYDATSTYNVGDYCIHNGTLYRCTTQAAAEAWTAGHWTAETAGTALAALKTSLSDKANKNGSDITNPSTWRSALELTYKANDTFNATGIGAPGYISNAAKSIHLYFTLPKSVGSMSTVTITTMAGYIRGGSGYIDNAGSETNYKSTATSIQTMIITDNVVRITLNKTSGFSNVTNNTNVFFSGDVTLKFT